MEVATRGLIVDADRDYSIVARQINNMATLRNWRYLCFSEIIGVAPKGAILWRRRL